MIDNGQETPEFEYQNTPEVNPVDSAIQQTEQSLVASPEQVNAAKERKAFETYVQANGVQVPENFKDIGSWFDSLKNAQKAYTQSRQEIAELKKKYNDSTENPAYKQPTENKPVSEKPKVDLKEELRIPDKAETPIDQKPTEVAPVTKEDWDRWSVEFSVKGDLNEQMMEEIRQKTKLPDFAIQEYMQGQKAKLQLAFGKAADLIGGRDRLAELFGWASQTMNPNEIKSLNAALATPSWDVALMGLASKYERATGDTVKKKEPAKGKQVPVSATQQGLVAYKTKREFYADRNNPRFTVDPKFRSAVESRMARTDFRSLPF
jgi:hypothetical protein